MSETRTRQKLPVDRPVEANPKPDKPDPLQDSLEELALMADALVDGLTMEEPVEPAGDPQEPANESPLQPIEQALHVTTTEHVAETRPTEEVPEHAASHAEETEPKPETAAPPTEALHESTDEGSQLKRREALKETLDALNDLIDDTPPVPAEIQVEGDRGEDISACLEKVMAPHDATLEAELVASETRDPETTGTDRSDRPGSNAPPVAPPDPTEETEVETAVAAGAAPAVATVTPTHAARSKRSTAVWWLVAVVVIIAALASSYWVLKARSTTAPTTTASVETPLPDPPVVYTKRPTIRTPTERTTPIEPAPARTESVARPVETPQATEAAPTRAAVAPAATSTASTPPETQAAPAAQPAAEAVTRAATTAQAEVEPSVAVAHAAAPQVEEAAAEAGDPATAQGDTPVPTPAVITSRGKTTETGRGEPQAAGVVGISVAEIITPPEPRQPEPVAATPPQEKPRSVTVEPVLDDPPVETGALTETPPVLVDRIDPAFDRRKLRRGEQQSVELRVLVDERGRVVRVVVEEGVAGSDAEFAAINAVLRWTYDPATAGGEPVRSWTTEKFEFSRPE